MTDLDPNAFRKSLEETLARFISTSTEINQIRAAGLAQSIRDLTRRQEIVKGPFLDTLPDFEKGSSLSDLVDQRRLDNAWRLYQTKSVFERQLHTHQEAAILRDDNYLVATGTGSGKTESFLYPMIDDILRQVDLKQPGVRVILVYPLNALASDQLLRIAQMLFYELQDPGITLGRYTGQVGLVAWTSFCQMLFLFTGMRRLFDAP